MATAATKLRDGLRDKLAATIGETLTFYTVSTGSYDPATGFATVSRASTTAVATPLSSARQTEVDGMNILTTDLRTFLPAKGVTITPEVDMEVANAAGDAYKIAAIREARMGDGTDGTIVGWTLFLRAGSA